jgi:predicted TIM-barrel fold metal-dependent hydrolase
MMKKTAFLLPVIAAILLDCQAQEMQWEEYDPVSSLVVEEHLVPSARYPFVDAHSHQWRIGTLSPAGLDSLVGEMDSLNMAVMVNLSGGSGDDLAQKVRNTDTHAPGRFVHFANIDFDSVDDPEFGAKAAAQLENDVRNGAKGLKIFKNLGMDVHYADGTRVPTDDPRLDPIWEKAGELGIPVLIHTGDPAQFWQPHDKYNERWFELKERSGRKRPPEPSWETIMGEHWNLIRRHPNTTFISAHLSWLGNDLGQLSKLLDEMPNMYTELGAVVAELGRQPRTAREFLIEYQDRVLMGKDSWAPAEYHTYFRVFETADEYFPYYRKRHAFWRMYGLDLPDEVLRKVYFENALRIIPGIDRRHFPGA